MNSGKYIFTQIADLIMMTPFRKLVRKYRGDYRAHDLTCYNQFLHLLFGQLSSCTSLRDICLCLMAHESSLFHMGFGNTVDHTTLSRANVKRDYRIYEELGYFLIKTIRPLYADEKLDDVNADIRLLALDSTTISVSLKLCAWALGKYERGDIKMHTLLDLICAYLLLAWTKKLYQSDFSITEIATLVSLSLFEKADLKGLLTQPNDKLGYLNSNQNVKELTLF